MSDVVPVMLPKWAQYRLIDGDRVAAVTVANAPGGGRSETWELACGGVVQVSQFLRALVTQGASPLDGYYIKRADGTDGWMAQVEFESTYSRSFATPPPTPEQVLGVVTVPAQPAPPVVPVVPVVPLADPVGVKPSL